VQVSRDNAHTPWHGAAATKTPVPTAIRLPFNLGKQKNVSVGFLVGRNPACSLLKKKKEIASPLGRGDFFSFP
jgi:hypothetical protein